ncbi:hypothetical protein [Rhizobium laguerreae]|uniref:hypothetical protein n=1 Tax=Rhizobium laguerreae TaxID=1076926 RepID=UPI001C90C842|nr:hypothetical protein [Rhizobium laguerreae]MBY3441766.1 hypothetical protein [Rhizobium laguerreae]
MRKYIALIILLLAAMPTSAANCNTDCNKECCKTVKITPWDKNSFCEPVCKSSCEATKRACKLTGGVLPEHHPKSGVNVVVDALEHSCAAAFQAINTFVIVSQGSYSASSRRMLDEAKSILIDAGIINANEFANVSVRWAKLVGDGQAPDRGSVLLSDTFLKEKNLLGATTTLAHEMIHIRQYRRMGTDNFKCEYSKSYVRCGCQNYNHPLEAEAYRFENRIGARVYEFINNNYEPTSSTCVTQHGSCQYQNKVQSGMACQCMMDGQIIWGQTK